MRIVRVSFLVALAGLASVLFSVAPVAAQGSVGEPSGGNTAVRARTEGVVAPHRIFVPGSFGDFRLNFMLAFARYSSSGWLPARAQEFSNPVGLTSRKRWSH